MQWIILASHTAAQPPIERFPSADSDRLQHHQEAAFRFVLECRMLPAISVCCQMTEVPGRGPSHEQSRQRSRSAPRRFLTSYIIHIHKHHPVVTEWTHSTLTVYPVQRGPVPRLSVRYWLHVLRIKMSCCYFNLTIITWVTYYHRIVTPHQLNKLSSAALGETMLLLHYLKGC